MSERNAPRTDEQILAGIEQFLRARLPERSGLKVTGLKKHTEGFSLETYSFDVEWHENGGRRTERLVVRKEPPAGLLEPYDLEPQYRVLAALADTPVVAPRVLWFESDPSFLGAPFYVMEWVEGEVPLPILDEDGGLPIRDDAVRESVGRDFARILAAIHTVDWRAKELDFLGAPRDGRDAAERAVDTWAGYIERARLGPLPMLTYALGWLRRHLPREAPITLVHGDYRTGNFIMRAGRIVAFLDWEMVHLGDPMEDVAWSVSRIWRGESGLAGHLIERERLFEWYREAGGHEVDEERVRFYEVLSGVKMAAIMLTGIKAWHDGRTRDMRMGFFDQQLAGMHAIIADAMGLIQLP